jgi:hypothetical protein
MGFGNGEFMVAVIQNVTYSSSWKGMTWTEGVQVVRNITGPEVEEIMGYWRKLRNEHHS